MELKCDVLVVGAGPAGSMAAKTAAEGGADVVLIERNKEIGYPVRCAEGINKYIFEDTCVKKNNSFIRQKIDKTKIYCGEESLELKSDQWRGYTIDRRVFDKHLADLAEDAGALIFRETKATGIKSMSGKRIVNVASKKINKSIEAKIVVGADGFDCKIGLWAGITKPWSINEFSKCLQYEMTHLDLEEQNAFHIVFGREFPKGYGWIFPKSKNIANVGVGVFPKCDAKKALEYLIEKHPGIRPILGEKYKISGIRGGGIPVNGPRSIDQCISDGVILVGDAGGLVEPVTGEGIASSMLSGIAAGETICQCLEKGRFEKSDLKIYESLWKSKNYMGSDLGTEMDALLSFKPTLDEAVTGPPERLLDALRLFAAT